MVSCGFIPEKGNMKFLGAVAIWIWVCGVASGAQGIITLTAGLGETNVVSIAEGQSFKFVGVYDNYHVQIKKGKIFDISVSSTLLVVVAGPATVCLSKATNLQRHVRFVCCA
jgi:hypothetical protein